MAKKKIGEIYDKPIVIGDKNLVTENEIHVDELGRSNADIEIESIIGFYNGYSSMQITFYLENGEIIDGDYIGVNAVSPNNIEISGSQQTEQAYVVPVSGCYEIYKDGVKLEGVIKKIYDYHVPQLAYFVNETGDSTFTFTIKDVLKNKTYNINYIDVNNN